MGIFRGKIRKIYNIEFKLKAIKLYFEEGMGAVYIGKELGIAYAIVERWVNHNKRGRTQ